MTVGETARQVADIVIREELAVVFSHRIDKDDPDAGKKGKMGWQAVGPWPRQNHGGLIAQIESYYGKRNLLVVTGQSNVVTVDVDSEAGLKKWLTLDWPDTLVIKSGRDGGGFHYVFRPPPHEGKHTFFEMAGEEKGDVTGAASNKLHVIAGLHKTGRPYEIWHDLPIAEIPQGTYDRLTARANRRKGQYKGTTPLEGRVPPSGRHEFLLMRANQYAPFCGVDVLCAVLKRDWEDFCVPDPGRDIDDEIERIVSFVKGT